MNWMTDQVFEAVLSCPKPPMIIGSSSVHSVDGLYSFYDEGQTFFWTLAERNFDAIDTWPEKISAKVPAHAINDYGREKAYVEDWVKRMAEKGHSAIATRWGGINAKNSAVMEERGYFSVWCHQEDSARFVNSCLQASQSGVLRSGAHYYVISNNTHNIFDIATPGREIGYKPQHDAQQFYD